MKNDKKKSSRTVWIILGIIAGIVLLLTILGIIGGFLLMRSFNMDVGSIVSGGVVDDYDHPYLSDDQEDLLKNWGISPSSLPTDVSQAQLDCALDAVGQARATEILNGATPSFTEMTKVMPCLDF